MNKFEISSITYYSPQDKVALKEIM